MPLAGSTLKDDWTYSALQLEQQDLTQLYVDLDRWLLYFWTAQLS